MVLNREIFRVRAITCGHIEFGTNYPNWSDKWLKNIAPDCACIGGLRLDLSILQTNRPDDEARLLTFRKFVRNILRSNGMYEGSHSFLSSTSVVIFYSNVRK